jgi:hypothetical protein
LAILAGKDSTTQGTKNKGIKNKGTKNKGRSPLLAGDV